VYVSTPSPSYSCAFDLVAFDVDNWHVTVNGSSISIFGSPIASGFGGGINTMTGTIDCQTGSFTATHVVAGTCTETYTLTGQIQSVASWTGTFTASYSGLCSIGGPCTNQIFQVSGALPPTGIGPRSATPGAAWLDIGPNPFDSATTVHVGLGHGEFVRLVVHDVSGHAVATLESGEWIERGDHRYRWDGRSNAGARVPAGVYFVRLQAGGAERVAKLVVLD
jgi:hypothetical protein